MYVGILRVCRVCVPGTLADLEAVCHPVMGKVRGGGGGGGGMPGCDVPFGGDGGGGGGGGDAAAQDEGPKIEEVD